MSDLEKKVNKENNIPQLEFTFRELSKEEIIYIAKEAIILRDKIQEEINKYTYIYPYYRTISI